MRVVLAVFAVLMAALLSGCSSSTGTTSSGAASSSATSAKPPYDGSAYAATIYQAILDGLGFKTTEDACAVGADWVCAIAKIESLSPGSVKVTLKPQQVWVSMTTETDLRKFGEQVARGVYNFADAAGAPTPGGGWQKAITAPHQVDVYESSGDTVYLSPLDFPGG